MSFDEDRYIGEGPEPVGFDLCTKTDSTFILLAGQNWLIGPYLDNLIRDISRMI